MSNGFLDRRTTFISATLLMLALFLQHGESSHVFVEFKNCITHTNIKYLFTLAFLYKKITSSSHNFEKTFFYNSLTFASSLIQMLKEKFIKIYVQRSQKLASEIDRILPEKVINILFKSIVDCICVMNEHRASINSYYL